jgi:hypothetical protein
MMGGHDHEAAMLSAEAEYCRALTPMEVSTMQLPRFRFQLRTIVIAIAVVAARISLLLQVGRLSERIRRLSKRLGGKSIAFNA